MPAVSLDEYYYYNTTTTTTTTTTTIHFLCLAYAAVRLTFVKTTSASNVQLIYTDYTQSTMNRFKKTQE